MTNKEILSQLKLTAKLLELHDANPFKVRGFTTAVFNLEKIEGVLSEMTEAHMTAIDGVSKGMAQKIDEIKTTGTFGELQELLETTPPGVIDMLGIKGIGPKKIRSLWQNEGIETTEDLLKACEEDRISKMKGFGKKTQDSIKEALLFMKAQEGRFMYAEIEETSDALEQQLSTLSGADNVATVGQVIRRLEVVDVLSFLIATTDIEGTRAQLDFLEETAEQGGPFVFRGRLANPGVKVEIHFCAPEEFLIKKVLLSSGPGHLGITGPDNLTLQQHLLKTPATSEESFYDQIGFHYIPAEAREGQIEGQFSKDQEAPKLLESGDLKGILHNHSTYSDGKNTLREMAEYCKSLGYEYLGISDHSVTAFYANGLDEDRIAQQQREIDELNAELAPFKIFKGIESDILNDGALDYSDEVLGSFDFIVSSIHSNLGMDKAKATARLIKAVENPYTTILGHMTGRLLLRREGYPVDHAKIIDACAANNVVIEINANPWRLDIDWRWVHYALEKEVILAINPDAHEKMGYHDMKYGVFMGRKGGLTPEQTLNAWSLDKVAAFFANKGVAQTVS